MERKKKGAEKQLGVGDMIAASHVVRGFDKLGDTVFFGCMNLGARQWQICRPCLACPREIRGVASIFDTDAMFSEAPSMPFSRVATLCAQRCSHTYIF